MRIAVFDLKQNEIDSDQVEVYAEMDNSTYMVGVFHKDVFLHGDAYRHISDRLEKGEVKVWLMEAENE